MKEKPVDELIISYLFPPSKDIAGMILAKRFMVEKKPFDVIQANIKSENDFEFKKLVDKYINEQILIDINCSPNFPKCIFPFIDKSMEILDKRDTYKKINTIVWKIANNFLALEYKLKHPEVYWAAEFSDPLLFGIYNQRLDNDKNKNINDMEYLSKINEAISQLNKTENTDFPIIEDNTNVHFLVEYLTYLFADEIIFTNKNQMDMMLNQFPVDVKSFVEDKSVIKPHPTLPEEYYHVINSDDDFDSSKINIGYFGNIYSKRHFEIVYNAFEILNHKHKDKLEFHFYVYEKDFVLQLTEGLEISNNLHIKDAVDFLEFLNLTTKLDVLIVNDLITQDCFDANPYLPSKISDYAGSGSDIWAICEKGSTLSRCDVKYRSYIHDLKSNVDTLAEILKDHSYDDDFSISDSYEYMQKRLTRLNVLIDTEHKKAEKAKNDVKKFKRANSKLKKDNTNIKQENEKILSSNSWKLTKSFRKVGSIIKK